MHPIKSNEFKTACRGCHGGCMHILTVEDGKLTAIRPDPDGPLNRGHICPKGATIIEQTYHPDRLLYPLRRVGERGSGQWERITWDQAYDIIAEKVGSLVREHGPECVASFTGTGRHHPKYLARFMNVLGSPNGTSTGTFICMSPRRSAANYTAGLFAGVDYFGEVKPGGILVWGTSPDISGPDGELQWFIKDAMKRSTPMVVVDPYPTALAKNAELWLRIRPGTDGALALGLLNIIISEDLYDHEFVENWTIGFEELAERCREYDLARVSHITGIPAEDILRAAHWIAQTKPLALEWGPAIEQCVNTFQTCRAVFMLPAITGNWDVPGGFVESMELGGFIPLMRERVAPERIARVLRKPGYARCGPPLLAHPYEILDAMRTGEPYKIRALFTHASNTVLSMADSLHTYECLKCLDFFVYMDFFMTPTAELADLVLPAALWPEVDSVFAMPEFGDQAMLCQQKLIQVGECKSDEQFFFELSARMGLDYGAGSHEEILDGILHDFSQRRPEYAGINFEQFKKIGYIEPERTYYNYKKRGFLTASGKFELYSQAVQEDGADALPCWTEPPESPVSDPELAKEYPLILTTGRRQQSYFISNNRQIRTLRKAAPFPLVSMHPDTAAKYGISQGDWVFIETPRGKITQKAEFVPEMDPQVINCQFGWWYPEDPSPLHGCFESNANVLTVGAPPYDEFGAYQMRGLLCRISRNPSKEIEERYYASDLAGI